MRSAAALACLLLTLASAACIPCDCKEATLINPAGFKLKIAFDSSILPWVKDEFTITMILPTGEVRTIHGTYKESGDTIEFESDGKAPFLSVKSGEINRLDCDKPMKGQFTVTPPAPAPPPGGLAVPAIPLTFQCTKT